jgi:hypothetical protein
MTFLANPLVESHRQYRLPTGDLHLTLHRETEPFDSICGVAARANPKRGFLFVSRLLGRYTPIQPSSLRNIQQQLALSIPHDIPGPVLVVGMAEAAVGLAQGIHDEFTSATHRKDVLFSHTTRYVVQGHRTLSFQEEHSHAPQHFFYWPRKTEDAELINRARTLVVVDDECTTKKTFFNFVQAIRPHLPHLNQARLMVIHDWAAGITVRSGINLDCDFHAVTVGQWRFSPQTFRQNALQLPPNAKGNGSDKTGILKLDFGRVATQKKLYELPPHLPPIKASKNERVLVLGTGEFQYLPFCWAETLEADGVDVQFQSTTRSPLLLGGEIQAALKFEDSYGEGIPYYLYNSKLEDFDRVFFCCESTHLLIPEELASLPNLTPVYF